MFKALLFFMFGGSFGALAMACAVAGSMDDRQRRAKPVIVSNGLTGHCSCGACGKAIDPWDNYCKHCGVEVFK